MAEKKLNLSALKKAPITADSISEDNFIDDLILEPTEIGIQAARDEITVEEMPVTAAQKSERIENLEEIEQESALVLEEEQEEKPEKKIALEKKKRTMLSLNSIKSKPKTEAEKKEEAKQAEIEKQKAVALAKTKEVTETAITTDADTASEVTTWESENEIENSDSWEEQELVVEDKKIVEEATKHIVEEIKVDEHNIEDDTVQITLDKSLFENYIPNYRGKKEAKAAKKEKKTAKATKGTEKIKRIRGPINKKKRNLLIVAMFLCILGAGGFVLYPHLDSNNDIKSDVVQITQNEVREQVDLVLEVEQPVDQEEEIIEIDEAQETGTSEISEENDIFDEDDIETKEEEKNDETKVKNYLLDNYYK